MRLVLRLGLGLGKSAIGLVTLPFGLDFVLCYKVGVRVKVRVMIRIKVGGQ